MQKSLAPAFYRQVSETHYQPTSATIGPWSSSLQHGGPPAALLTHALRVFPSEYGLQIARLTVEILCPIPLAPCSVSVRVLRAGKRVELLQAEMRSGDKLLLIAHAWRVERQDGCAPSVPDPFVLPALPPEQEQIFFPGVDFFGYGYALEWRFVAGSFVEPGPATVWTRPRIPLIEGLPDDTLESLVLMLDSANGAGAELDFRQWSFVPIDLSLSLHRYPSGPWLGMEAKTMITDSGIGTVTATSFDLQGGVGRSLHTLFVRAR